MECLKCKITDNDHFLNCDGCERYIHSKSDCSGLSAAELKVMGLRGKRALRFYCEECQTGIRLIPKLIEKIEELKKDVDALKAKIENTSNTNELPMDDAVITELAERQKRSNNVMIFNLPEEGVDLEKTKDLIHLVTGQHLHVTELSRIGRKNKNGYRALKISLANATDANKILTSKRESLKNKRIYLSADLTPSQINNWKKMKEELNARKSNGEDVGIKYIKGTPQIVKTVPKK